MVRYTLPLVAFLILAAALAMALIPLRGFWRPLVYLLIGSVPLAVSLAQVGILRRDHPANLAARWVEVHVPAGSRIGQIWPELPPLDQRRYDLHYLHGIFPQDKTDAQDLDRQYLILDDLPIQSFSESFSRRLSQEFALVAQYRSDPAIGPWVLDERSAPHDWKYTHPVLRIYRHK